MSSFRSTIAILCIYSTLNYIAHQIDFLRHRQSYCGHMAEGVGELQHWFISFVDSNSLISYLPFVHVFVLPQYGRIISTLGLTIVLGRCQSMHDSKLHPWYHQGPQLKPQCCPLLSTSPQSTLYRQQLQKVNFPYLNEVGYSLKSYSQSVVSSTWKSVGSCRQ